MVASLRGGKSPTGKKMSTPLFTKAQGSRGRKTTIYSISHISHSLSPWNSASSLPCSSSFPSPSVFCHSVTQGRTGELAPKKAAEAECSQQYSPPPPLSSTVIGIFRILLRNRRDAGGEIDRMEIGINYLDEDEKDAATTIVWRHKGRLL